MSISTGLWSVARGIFGATIGGMSGALAGGYDAIYHGHVTDQEIGSAMKAGFWTGAEAGAITGIAGGSGRVGAFGIALMGVAFTAQGVAGATLSFEDDSMEGGTYRLALATIAGVFTVSGLTSTLTDYYSPGPQFPRESIRVVRSQAVRRLYGVASEFQAADEAAGVLVNGACIKNPTAVNIRSLVSSAGKIGGKNMNGRFMYVVDSDGNIILGTRSGARMPHPTLIGGLNPKVQAAGIVDIRAGQIYSINSASGHFKPSIESLGAAYEAFKGLPPQAFHSHFQGYLPH